MSIVEQIAAQQINTASVATVEEVAHHYRVTPKTVRRMIESGRLRAIDCGSGTRKLWRIPWGNVLQSRAEGASE